MDRMKDKRMYLRTDEQSKRERTHGRTHGRTERRECGGTRGLKARLSRGSNFSEVWKQRNYSL